MLKEANRVCERLWRDESGVVLALTVVVFLSLFLMAVSVYAVGENIRQRIALQNAVDAAAYSGAVVQADALGRLAVLNQALSWEYAQLCKEQMSYVIGKWAQRVRDDYLSTAGDHYNAAMSEALAAGLPAWGIAIGQPPAPLPLNTAPALPLLLGTPVETQGDWRESKPGDIPATADRYPPELTGPFQEIWALASAFDVSGAAWLSEIESRREYVWRMSAIAGSIQDGLRESVRNAVQYVLKANLKGEANPDYYWALSLGPGRVSPDPAELPPMLRAETDSEGFFALCGIDPGAPDVHTPYNSPYFGPGWQTWYQQQMAGDLSRGGDLNPHAYLLTAHGYEQAPLGLTATWTIVQTPPGLVRTYTRTAESCRDAGFDSGCAPQAKLLTEDYFARSGAVSVGLSRRLRNPFEYVRTGPADVGTDEGLFKVFDLGDKRVQWAVAAARAGFDRDDAGNYDPHASRADWLDTRAQDEGNLSVRFWDAVMIPLRRAWAPLRETGSSDWGSDTTTEILQAFADEGVADGWQGLFAEADPDSKPDLMNTFRLGWGETLAEKEGADGVALDWSGAEALERWVWH